MLKKEKEKKINKNSKITLHVLKVINEGLQTNNLKKMLIGLTIIIIFLDSQINLRVIYRHLCVIFKHIFVKSDDGEHTIVT